jgi:hypothetical protein
MLCGKCLWNRVDHAGWYAGKHKFTPKERMPPRSHCAFQHLMEHWPIGDPLRRTFKSRVLNAVLKSKKATKSGKLSVVNHAKKHPFASDFEGFIGCNVGVRVPG